MNNKNHFLSLQIVATFYLMFVNICHAEIFTCVEKGRKAVKSSDTCYGKITSVFTRDGRNISYEEYLSELKDKKILTVTSRNKENLESNEEQFELNRDVEKVKNQKAQTGDTTLDQLKASCSSEYKEFDTRFQSNKWSARYKFNLKMLRNKCSSKSIECYESYDKLYQINYDKASNEDYVSAKQKAEIIDAECGF